MRLLGGSACVPCRLIHIRSDLKTTMDANIQFREATSADLPALVQLLADDELGAQREDTSHPLNARYRKAFEQIAADPNNELIVIHEGDELVGTLQLTFTPYLTHTGTWRCTVEGVRIASRYRGAGMGNRLLRWAIQRAEQRGCNLVQLTSDKRRKDAIRFYESLGFHATHEGFKLAL